MDPEENMVNGSCRFDSEKRISLLEPRFECPICLNCLKDPFLTKCGHRFCQDCILEWIRNKKREWCPVDQNKIQERDLFPDNYTRREITQQMVRCSFPNCETITPLLDLEKHLVENHENNKSNLNGDVVDDIAKKAETWEAPPKNQCTTQIQLITTLYERVVQLEQKQRESELQLEHKTRQEQKMKDLILQLEHKTRDFELQLTNSRATINNMLIERDQFLSQLPLKICNGCHVWNVVNIKQKLLAMSKEPSEMYYSEGFYTSYLGYKFCVRMNLSPNNPCYLSLLVHLMKSENDHILGWPFKGRISFTLIHPVSQEHSLSEVMCTKSGLKAFERPVAALSPRAFGYTEFALIDDVINKGFINDDESVNIKIEINCV
uniref:TNF-receptor-associated factor 6 n=1 Tax=Plautia stali TaxID=106108 RepID=A0A499U580_PLAST|nr:TNF-receptor-associated factor 6 [Plautia stali]